MAKHNLERNHINKKGKQFDYRCKTCLRKWVTKNPSDDECKGRPNFEGMEKNKAAKDEKTVSASTSKGSSKRSSRDSIVAQGSRRGWGRPGGEVAKIGRIANTDPQRALKLRHGYLKNVRKKLDPVETSSMVIQAKNEKQRIEDMAKNQGWVKPDDNDNILNLNSLTPEEKAKVINALKN